MSIHQLLMAYGSSPILLALSILISTFFLEDVTIGYAALLAAMGTISPLLAFIALFLGVYLGDLGLYFGGVLARRFERARRYIGEDRLTQAKQWLDGRALSTLIAARVIPGSRLPIYAAGGYLQLPFRTFASITAATSLAWTTTLFIAGYAFGMKADALSSGVKFGAISIIGLSVIALPLLFKRYLKRSMGTAAA